MYVLWQVAQYIINWTRLSCRWWQLHLVEKHRIQNDDFGEIDIDISPNASIHFPLRIERMWQRKPLKRAKRYPPCRTRLTPAPETARACTIAFGRSPMSQTREDVSVQRNATTPDELAALQKLEEAERLASECSRLDEQIDSAGQSNDASQTNEVAMRETLNLWMTWNRAHQAVTGQLFKNGEQNQKVEDLMDHLDALRQECVERSERLLPD